MADQYEGEAISTATEAELAALAKPPTSRSRQSFIDGHWMGRAILLAKKAEQEGMRPFGCVILGDGRWRGPIALTYGSEHADDPTRHSEILAIRYACNLVGGLLQGGTLYSTHEPCTMCAGAICHSKLKRVVFGSYRHDLPELFRAKQHSSLELFRDTTTPVQVVGGVLRTECIALFDAERERLRNGH